MPDFALPDPRLLTVQEIAELAGVTRMTIYRRIRAGHLPGIRFGRSYRVPEAVVLEALRLTRPDQGGEPQGMGEIGKNPENGPPIPL